MDEQQLQQLFIQYLQQQSGAQTEEELNQYIQSLGEEGLQQAYAEFMQLLQQQQGGAQQMMDQSQPVGYARNGAKLNYINYLRGKCPEGYEVAYFKRGGNLCKTCQKKQEVMRQGGDVAEPSDAVEAFKCGRKMKKKKAACGTKIDSRKGGGGMNGVPYTRKKQDDYNWTDTKKDSQGKTSTRTVTEDGTLYTGRNGKSGMEGTAVGDSIRNADWRTGNRVNSPALKKKVTKHEGGTGKGGVKPAKSSRNNSGYTSKETIGEEVMAGSPISFYDKPAQTLIGPDGQRYMSRVIAAPGDTVYVEPRFVPQNDPRYQIYRNEFNRLWNNPAKKANGGSLIPFMHRGLR